MSTNTVNIGVSFVGFIVKYLFAVLLCIGGFFSFTFASNEKIIFDGTIIEETQDFITIKFNKSKYKTGVENIEAIKKYFIEEAKLIEARRKKEETRRKEEKEKEIQKSKEKIIGILRDLISDDKEKLLEIKLLISGTKLEKSPEIIAIIKDLEEKIIIEEGKQEKGFLKTIKDFFR